MLSIISSELRLEGEGVDDDALSISDHVTIHSLPETGAGLGPSLTQTLHVHVVDDVVDDCIATGLEVERGKVATDLTGWDGFFVVLI